MQQVIHYFLHFIFPAALARIISKEKWFRYYLIMIAANLIDLDHLLSVPVFDSSRCSIGFHALHGFDAITASFILLIPDRTRIFALGLILHFATDFLDCRFMIT